MSVDLFQGELRTASAEDDRGVVLRPASESDIDGIRTIEAKPAYRECIGHWSEEEYREAIADPGQEVVVAVREAAVLGFYVLRDLGGKDRCVILMRIAVADPGNGVGSTLLQCALRRAFEEHGAHRLWLDVFTTNHRAEALYRSFGFVAEGVLRESKLRDGRYQSQRIMSMLESEYRERKAV